MYAFVQNGLVTCTVVWQHGIVDALSSLLGVELAVVAVFVLALIVVDAVGHIRSLLDLCHETARADCVDTAGGDEEHVALLYLVARQCIDDGVVRNHLFIFLGGNLLLQTIVKMGARG